MEEDNEEEERERCSRNGECPPPLGMRPEASARDHERGPGGECEREAEDLLSPMSHESGTPMTCAATIAP